MSNLLTELALSAAVTGILVEIDGLIYGPFADREVAFTWAASKNKSPFSVKIMVDPRIA